MRLDHPTGRGVHRIGSEVGGFKIEAKADKGLRMGELIRRVDLKPASGRKDEVSSV